MKSSSASALFNADLIPQPLKSQLAFLHWALRFNITRQAYQEFVSKFSLGQPMPSSLATLVRRGWKHFASVLSISTLSVTQSGETIPWVSLSSLAKCWLANQQTFALIDASNASYVYPFIQSYEILVRECLRRESWLQDELGDEEVYLRDSFDSLSFLEDLKCTWDQWQPVWKLHQDGKAIVRFLHFRMFPDGLGIWTRREEGFYALLFTLLEFPAATRVGGACVTVGEATLMTRSALHEITWGTINSRILEESHELVKGVLVGTDEQSGTRSSFFCFVLFCFVLFFVLVCLVFAFIRK